jgi:membrane-bound serine protease (ClpP class)
MRLRNILQILVFVFVLLPWKLIATTIEIKEISLLSVNSAITPATYDYLKQTFYSLPKTGLIVLRLNTPGGLVSTTKDIITLVGRSKRPFVVWITPEGASAASAGAIIASAAHFIFMSPGTNIGAATPIGLGEDIKESDSRNKAMSDLAALVRSLSLTRNRPAIPFEKMITQASSYSAQEALNLNIINGIISHEDELVSYLNEKKINIDGIEHAILIKKPVFKTYEPSTGQQILEVLANPSTAYILFLIGVALVYFEFQAPGGFILGSVGTFFLLVSAISFQILPLDWGSMGLILIGIFLLILELFVVSYGILSIAGLISFVMGSLFLFHDESGFISIEYSVIISSLVGTIFSVGLMVWYVFKDSKKQNLKENFFMPLGATGYILTKLNSNEYQVKVNGEIWNASSEEELNLHDAIEVIFVDQQHLSVKIKKQRS